MDELSMAHSAQVSLCKRIQNGAMKEENFPRIINDNYQLNLFTRKNLFTSLRMRKRLQLYYSGILTNTRFKLNMVTRPTRAIV